MQISGTGSEFLSVRSTDSATAAVQKISAQAQSPAITSASSAVAAASLPVVNPASHIDPALGIVVVEHYDRKGEVAAQYPTAHMLHQYSLFGFSSGSDS